jgi:hypothetical protein
MSELTSKEMFPVQTPRRWTDGAQIPGAVYLAAYEVYCHLWGPQEAMVDHARGCRGGFTAGEIVAFLYAKTFPKDQWRARFEEATKGASL